MPSPSGQSDTRPGPAYAIAHDLWERLPQWARLGSVGFSGYSPSKGVLSVAVFDVLADGRQFRVIVNELDGADDA